MEFNSTKWRLFVMENCLAMATRAPDGIEDPKLVLKVHVIPARTMCILRGCFMLVCRQ